MVDNGSSFIMNLSIGAKPAQSACRFLAVPFILILRCAFMKSMRLRNGGRIEACWPGGVGNSGRRPSRSFWVPEFIVEQNQIGLCDEFVDFISDLRREREKSRSSPASNAMTMALILAVLRLSG